MPARRLPAFQFYPADLLKDTGYRRCTKAERGVLLDFLCFVTECSFRGAAYDNGTSMDLDEVALAIGGDKAENKELLKGVIAKGPIKVWSKVNSMGELKSTRLDLCPDFPEGTLFNRRMLLDEIRRIAGSKAGKAGGGNPALSSFKGIPKGAPKGRPIGKRGSSSSSSDKEIPSNAVEVFETFHKAYPGTKRGHEVEYAHFLANHKDRVAEILSHLLPAAKAYTARCEQEGIEPRFRKHLATWIKNECWTEESPTAAHGPERPRHQTEPDSNLTDWELAEQEAGHG